MNVPFILKSAVLANSNDSHRDSATTDDLLPATVEIGKEDATLSKGTKKTAVRHESTDCI